MSIGKQENSELVHRLRLLIGERSQKDFAEWLGVVPQQITDYISGKAKPSWNFLEKLASKGINVNWFLSGVGNVWVTGKKYDMTEEMQLLVKELEDAPNLAPKLTELIRRTKEANEAEKNVKSTLEELKKVVYKRKKK